MIGTGKIGRVFAGIMVGFGVKGYLFAIDALMRLAEPALSTKAAA